LELAATRVPALGVAELAARLRVPHDRFGLLGSGPRDAPARQRTLAAVIDWSWRLLGEQERVVLRRLAVHSGGCTLAAAQAVGGSEAVVLDLVDRSLVVRTDGPRFRLLESVSAYCLDRLREAGEEQEARLRHAEYYLELAERAESQLRGPGQREWLRVLDAESANLRAALDTLRRTGSDGAGLRLVEALVWYWILRGRLTEARRALAATGGGSGRAAAWEAGLAMRQGLAGPERIEQVLRGHDDPRARWFLANASIDFGDVAATGALLESALEEFRATGDRWGEAAALSTRAMLAHMRDDPDALEHDARRSAELFGELGDEWGVLQATDWLIGHADMIGDHASAMRLSRDGLRIAEELGLWSDVAGRLGWLAWISVQIADYAAALDHAQRAKRLAAEQGVRAVEVFATIGLAFAARRDGRRDLAEEHLRWLLSTARAQTGGEGHPPYLPMVLTELGLLAAQRGDSAGALDLHREAFEVNRDQASPRGMAWALACLGDALTLGGRGSVAAQLLGAADAAWRKSGLSLSTSDSTELARITAAVEAAEPAFADHFARGAQLTPDEAYALL
uniref:ATP-binding protein n=1 Tax=Allorhizocola rhizosphaerae TaxID=1872709 RepID=UPI003CCC6940